MKTFAPDYYKSFKCIAGECRHTCCAGWEIDIDEETAEYYRNVPGEFGKKLRRGIDFCEGCASFVLQEGERCPFLNEKGLCEIILNLGEDALCQVCDDHPRFRNFFSGRTEVGLGLCCEAAAKLILEKQSKTELLEIADDGEDDAINEEEAKFLALREKIFAVLQDRKVGIDERTEKMLGLCGAKLPRKSAAQWAEIFEKLERLDEGWSVVLEKIKTDENAPPLEETAKEQLLCYFVFRHLAGVLDDGRLGERAAFAALGCYMVEKAAAHIGLLEAARLYSSEVEYSDENTEALLSMLGAEKEV